MLANNACVSLKFLTTVEYAEASGTASWRAGDALQDRGCPNFTVCKVLQGKQYL